MILTIFGIKITMFYKEICHMLKMFKKSERSSKLKTQD